MKAGSGGPLDSPDRRVTRDPGEAVALVAQALPCGLLVGGRRGPPDEGACDPLDGLIAAVTRHDHAPAAWVEHHVHLCDRVDGVDQDSDKYGSTEGCEQIELSACFVQSIGPLVHAVIVSHRLRHGQPSK